MIVSPDRTKLLCFAVLPDGYGFERSVAAAAAAGFTELSLWLMSIDAAREELGSLQAVRACLDRHGLRASCLELLLAWPGGEPAAVREELEVMQAAAAVFEPELVMAACMAAEMPDRARALAGLKQQCRALAPLRVGLEFLPWSAIPDLHSARRLVDAVGEDNLGFVLDSWHFARSGADYEALQALPAEQVFMVQLSDAGFEPNPDILHETLCQRLAPGEGMVDWPRFLEVLRQPGLSCPIGTEQYSDRVKAMGLEEACDYLYASIQRLIPAQPRR